MVISWSGFQRSLGIFILSILFIIAFFFPYLQNVGLKWQLSVIPAVLLLFTNKAPIEIKQFDLLLLALSFYCFFLFIISGLPIHFNLSLGLLITLFVSKSDVNEAGIIIFCSAILFLHHMLTGMLPFNNYTAQFNNLNQFYGANRSAFLFFVGYFFFYLQDSRLRFPFLILSGLHSARFMIASFLMLELVRRKNVLFFSIISLLGILIIFGLVEFWIIEYYFLNLSDASASNRLSRYLTDIIGLTDNLLLPRMEYTKAPHNFFLEIALYLGLPGLLIVTIFWLLNTKKYAMIAFVIALMSPKTVHDLLAFYLSLGLLFKYANLPTKTILNIRFSLLSNRMKSLSVYGQNAIA